LCGGAGTLDSLPHNGAVVTLLAVCGSSHRESYSDIVIVGIVGALIALAAGPSSGSAAQKCNLASDRVLRRLADTLRCGSPHGLGRLQSSRPPGRAWASCPRAGWRLSGAATGKVVLRFLCQSVVASTDVARRVLDPRLPLRQGFVTYPVQLAPGAIWNTFCTLSSFLPGRFP
jgi:hypothetical protein